MGWMDSGEGQKVKLYLQALSSPCMDDQLAFYFTLHEFGKIKTEFRKKFIYKKLKELKIYNDHALKYKLSWLMNEGNRTEFKKMQSYLSALSEPNRKSFIHSLSKENNDHLKWNIVDYYLKKLPAEGIAAFDYAWYIYLCRAGMATGFLDEKEARSFMMKAAKLAQQSYSGWESYIAAYVCGSQFVSSDKRLDFTKQNHVYFSKLFAARRSPIRQIDWKIHI
jgi:hypothetical protein